MNYRHAFHAGNFADVFKHAVLLGLVDGLMRRAPVLRVIETHAGAGVYDLESDAARRTGEAAGGIRRALAGAQAPASVDALTASVRALNRGGGMRRYPGSPRLVCERLRLRDRYLGFEARDEETAVLRRSLAQFPQAKVVLGDGWRALAFQPLRRGETALILIDPPFERSEDGVLAARLAAEALKQDPHASVALWAPIKDLVGFDVLRGNFAEAGREARVLIGELRLRPLDDPMRLNGCAMLLINPPPDFAAELEAIARWCAGVLGEKGAEARVETGTVPPDPEF
ncbi:MAG TPA: 23S rRNA (adenine(2030)-N(6))-methyltransferase RlmJ [Caulobacteraceae bacterium]|jgi:23S rRNA (adenine2030-N6)-methyltransferase|nr:23S rRNA (adenine(2030)-N(6))-methyltransferase RlmJ [Caulobacteraceae bacterium]